jgi:L-alanine-DL-glutamate epimerase-like enolase superfamily enzyme
MSLTSSGPMTLRAAIEQWPLVAPFQITGHRWESIDVLSISLEQDGQVGRGEAGGVYYRSDLPTSMIKQIESCRAIIEAGISREVAQKLLPPGGARNALDCALWDLEAKLSGCPAWQIAAVGKPRPLLTTFTCGADEPEIMAATARAYEGARAIKLKLTGEPNDAERVRAVRTARPDVWLGVDANQGFTRPFLERLMPVLIDTRVALIEQPFRVGQEALLEGFQSPIPFAADESAQSLADLSSLVGRFAIVNIKLDKCGGLTEGLAMARAARGLGLDTMIGNMMGTSLAMAPASLVGQLCDVVDLDGPIFLKGDRANPLQYAAGFITCPEILWGHPDA